MKKDTTVRGNFENIFSELDPSIAKEIDRKVKAMINIHPQVSEEYIYKYVDDLLTQNKENIKDWETESYTVRIRELADCYIKNNKINEERENWACLLNFLASNIIILINVFIRGTIISYVLCAFIYIITLSILCYKSTDKNKYSEKTRIFFMTLNSGVSSVTLIEMAIFYTYSAGYEIGNQVASVIAVIFALIFCLLICFKYKSNIRAYNEENNINIKNVNSAMMENSSDESNIHGKTKIRGNDF